MPAAKKPLNRQLLTLPQAAKQLGVSDRTLRRWHENSELPVKVREINGTSYIAQAALDRWIEKMAVLRRMGRKQMAASLFVDSRLEATRRAKSGSRRNGRRK